MSTLNEQWNALAEATMEREYARYNVAPHDHVGYYIAVAETPTAAALTAAIARECAEEKGK